MSLMYSERASIIIFIEQITINNTPMQINNAIFTLSLSFLFLNKPPKIFDFLNYHFDYVKISLTQIGQERWNT